MGGGEGGGGRGPQRPQCLLAPMCVLWGRGLQRLSVNLPHAGLLNLQLALFQKKIKNDEVVNLNLITVSFCGTNYNHSDNQSQQDQSRTRKQ